MNGWEVHNVRWSSVDHALFQARSWREYVRTFDDQNYRTSTGVDNRWVITFVRVDRAYCIARVRDALLAARDFNKTGGCGYLVGERA